jgi:hypothetical protein
MPPPRDTTTGGVFERMVPEALRHGGYQVEKPPKPIGSRLGGGRHYVDLVATKEGRSILVSLKWQQTSGTAEQKIPFEVMCLADAVVSSNGKFTRAYVVLGGDGWSLREFYVNGGLDRFLRGCESIKVVSMETFLGLANRGQA